METKTNKEETLRQFQTYMLQFPEEAENLIPFISFIKDREELFDRSVSPGHITGSGFVLHPNKPDHILMLFHKSLERWLQPGGHVDPGETPEEAAIREVKEETGIDVRLHSVHKEQLYPFDVNIHYIPTNKQKGEPGHFHYDFRYLFVTDETEIGQNDEDHDVRWVHVSEIPDQLMARAIKQIQALHQ
ncbi:NUDIX hydrolase [Allobacillus sp. SKP2-8]|uniref:NUDIX hydrolase n=1 Tax=unclassified Allobacillus TaxID=2628859 RepID=UPI0011839E0F|nr:NUDIX hydrolase [Allobacillus sp. SKP2-8]TSJ65110.1 NUDIX hydrolase [Allobacillus sp. SKP2-8]